jgi:hypothetical protein
VWSVKFHPALCAINLQDIKNGSSHSSVPVGPPDSLLMAPATGRRTGETLEYLLCCLVL